jgi:glycine/D-amino acid oxidase-like deaminating enzyme
MTQRYDVIVIGGGGSGLAAGLSAAETSRLLREEAISSVPRLRVGLFCDVSPGEFCPLRIPPFGMAAASPRDTSRKDGALSPVTSEKASSLSALREMSRCLTGRTIGSKIIPWESL